MSFCSPLESHNTNVFFSNPMQTSQFNIDSLYSNHQSFDYPFLNDDSLDDKISLWQSTNFSTPNIKNILQQQDENDQEIYTPQSKQNQVIENNIQYVEMTKCIPIKHINIHLGQEKKYEKNSKNFASLAYRNIKMNFGTGLIQFIEFLKELYISKENYPKYKKLFGLFIWINKKQSLFRSFQGWKELWTDPVWGCLLRKVSQQFFGKSYSKSYLLNSKIKIEYRKIYQSKLKNFYQGSKDPALFDSFNFS